MTPQEEERIKAWCIHKSRMIEKGRQLRVDSPDVEARYQLLCFKIMPHPERDVYMGLLENVFAVIGYGSKVDTYLRMADEDYRIFTDSATREVVPKPDKPKAKAPAKKKAAAKKASAAPKKKSGSTKPS